MIDTERYPLAFSQHAPAVWNRAGLQKSDISLPRISQTIGDQTIHVGNGHFAPHNHEGSEPRNLGFAINVADSCIGASGSYYGQDGFGLNSTSVHARPVPGLEKYYNTDTFLREALTLEARSRSIKH